MKKYRKNPIEVSAMEWTGDNLVEIGNFVGDMFDGMNTDCSLRIITLEGRAKAQVGDFVIKGIIGEFYPCRRDVFLGSYSEVKDK